MHKLFRKENRAQIVVIREVEEECPRDNMYHTDSLIRGDWAMGELVGVSLRKWDVWDL